jgi:hypothetical protein
MRALRVRVKDELPHASCVDKGDGAFRKTNAAQVAGLGRICFNSRSQVSGLRSQVSGFRSQVSGLRSQLSALSC